MAHHYAKPLFLSTLIIATVYILGQKLFSNPSPSDFNPENTPPPVANPSNSASTAGVAAVGYLEPLGDVIQLAAPTQAYNMQPLVASINVEEGQAIKRGQVLAIFDTFLRLKTQETSALALMKSLSEQLKIVTKEANRFRLLNSQGAASAMQKDQRELTLLELNTKLVEARSELRRLQEEKRFSVLVSPIDGMVLKILSKPGERVMPYGVMKVARAGTMGAVVQVYESYIGRTKLNSPVTIRSENGSFPGIVTGRISHVASIVGERKKLSLDPALDSDKESRTFEVEIKIDPAYQHKVKNLIGVKIIARY